MRELHLIDFGVLCLFTLFAAPFTGLAQDTNPRVILDTNPPVILSAVTGCDGLMTITVTYSEPVEPSAASDPFNYEVQDGQSNSLAILFVFLADPQTVVLRVTPPLSPQNSNSLHTVFEIPDLFGNVMPPVAVPIEFEFDTTPPVVTCSVATSTLFPPNNTLVNVGLNAATDPGG